MSRPAAGLWFGVNVVVTVLATLAIGVGAYSGTVLALHPIATVKLAPSPTPTIPSAASPSSDQPMPTPPSVTPRLAVEDVDLIDASTGWVLLTSCNAATSAKCQYLAAATTDGGDTWTKLAQVGSLFAPSDGSGPRHVRFANRLDGFVYGYSGAFVTHDGGNTWNSAGLPAQFVYDIAIGGRTAWAVTQPCPKGSFCQFEVRSSIDGGRTWSPPHSLPQNFDPVTAVGFDSGVVLGSLPVTGMQITSDGGKTWRSIKTQCTGSPNGESIATSDGKELWELCFGAAGRTLFVSGDGGKSWSQRATPRPSPAASPIAPPSWLISNRTHVAFTSGFPQPYVTRDGGATWSPVGSDQVQFGTMKFAGPVSGWALDTGMNLWVTANGGDSWSQAAALPTDAGQ